MTVRTAPLSGAAPEARPRPRLRERLGWVRPFSRDFGVVLLVIGVYFLLRARAPGNDDFAVAFTWWLVKFERAFGFYWEPQIQDWSIHYYWTKEAANFVYAYLHFPVLAVVGVWLWFKGRERFLLMRNTMFISMVIGLACYYALPAAPPRLMAMHGHDLGFVDTVFGGGTSVTYAQPALILNNYAAIPSFHFGWIALASAAVWYNTGSRILRAAAVLLSVVMGWAIVASANHLLIDMVLGLAVVVLSWYIARRYERRTERLRTS